VTCFNLMFLIAQSPVECDRSSPCRVWRCAEGRKNADSRWRIASQQTNPTVTTTAASDDAELHFVLCVAWEVAVKSTNWRRTEKWYEEIERKDEVVPNSSCFLLGTTTQ